MSPGDERPTLVQPTGAMFGSAAGSPPAPTPQLRVLTERRQRPLRAGIMIGVASLAAIVTGSVLLAAHQNLQVLDADGRAEIGNPISFETEDRSYSAVLLPAPTGRPFVPDPLVELACTVEHPDGNTDRIDAGRQTVRTETSLGDSMGTFDGQAGTTTIICDWTDGHDSDGYFYAVAPTRRAVQVVGWVLLGGGILGALVAAALITIGIRGRAVTVRA